MKLLLGMTDFLKWIGRFTHLIRYIFYIFIASVKWLASLQHKVMKYKGNSSISHSL